MIPALEAVNELLKPQELHLDDTRRTVKGPCLLAQLQAAVAAGTGARGGGRSTGSRPPIAVDALDLWNDIEHTAHHLAWRLNLSRTDPGITSQIPWVGRLLRTATATAHGRGWSEAVCHVESRARSWREQIEAMLTGQHTYRPIRGAQCPRCGFSTVHEQREDGLYRVPALVLVTETYQAERWLVCNACGHQLPAAEHVLDTLMPEDDDDTPEGDQLDDLLANAA